MKKAHHRAKRVVNQLLSERAQLGGYRQPEPEERSFTARTDEEEDELDEFISDLHLDDVTDSLDERTKESTISAIAPAVTLSVMRWAADHGFSAGSIPAMRAWAEEWVGDSYDVGADVYKEVEDEGDGDVL